jgi:hypothetical protein
MSDDFWRQAWAGFATGICIGLTLTLLVGLAAVILGHLCIIQGAGSCSWPPW